MCVVVIYQTNCDCCGKEGPKSKVSIMDSEELARSMGWSEEPVHYSALVIHYCSSCSVKMINCKTCNHRTINPMRDTCLICGTPTR